VRDSSKASIPVALVAFVWVSTAAWVHLGLGLAGYDIGVRHDDANALTTFTEHIGGRVDAKQRPMEIALDDSTTAAPPVDTTEPAPPPAPTETAKKDQPKPPPAAKPTPTDEPKKPEEKKVAVVPAASAAPVAPPPPPPQSDKRIAVKQHAKPNQDDNPNAAFIADEANKVDQETAATITSHDRDDENPTPGGNHPGSD
jgi:outer membrane biosynthesis protein TonB